MVSWSVTLWGRWRRCWQKTIWIVTAVNTSNPPQREACQRVVAVTLSVLCGVISQCKGFRALFHIVGCFVLTGTVDTNAGLYVDGTCCRRLNGLTSGVVTVVKGCLVRPLQERWTQNKDFSASAFDFVSFEPRYWTGSNTFCDLIPLWFPLMFLFHHCAFVLVLFEFTFFNILQQDILVSLIYWLLILVRSRDSSVGIVTGYWLDGRGVGVQVPEGREFSLLHVVQTGSGNHPASYPMGTRGSFTRGKAAGAWSWPLTSN
jgi:hypothetical protein